MKLEGEKLQNILEMLGIDEEELCEKVKDLIWLTDSYDKDLYTFEEYYGYDFMGKTLNDWIDDSEKQIIWIELFNKHKVCFLYLYEAIMSLKMLGDGECTECGFNEHSEYDRHGETIGDGYSSPFEFRGQVTCSCNNCGTLYTITV